MIEKISNIGFHKTVRLIKTGKAGVVLCCTLNEMMMAKDDVKVREAMDRAEVLTPDGMPLVWYLKWKFGRAERVYGPDILNHFLNPSNKFDGKMLFIGDKNNKLFFEKFGEYMVLPFRDEFGDEDYEKVAQYIKRLKPAIIWVGLGARKQVLMADGLRRYGVKSSIVTVGAAFDFLSGNKSQCPRIIRNMGLEWFYRMMCEPARLGGRYVKIVWYLWGQLVAHFVQKRALK